MGVTTSTLQQNNSECPREQMLVGNLFSHLACARMQSLARTCVNTCSDWDVHTCMSVC